MRDVAAFKWLNDRPVEDLIREQVVVDAALAEQRVIAATGAGRRGDVLPRADRSGQRHPGTTGSSSWQAGNPPTGAPDLAAEVRPQLLELGDQHHWRHWVSPLLHDSAMPSRGSWPWKAFRPGAGQQPLRGAAGRSERYDEPAGPDPCNRRAPGWHYRRLRAVLSRRAGRRRLEC